MQTQRNHKHSQQNTFQNRVARFEKLDFEVGGRVAPNRYWLRLCR